MATLAVGACSFGVFAGIALLIIGVRTQLVAERRPRPSRPGMGAVATVPAVRVYSVLRMAGAGLSLAMIWALLLAPVPAASVLMLLPVRVRSAAVRRLPVWHGRRSTCPVKVLERAMPEAGRWFRPLTPRNS